MVGGAEEHSGGVEVSQRWEGGGPECVSRSSRCSVLTLSARENSKWADECITNALLSEELVPQRGGDQRLTSNTELL